MTRREGQPYLDRSILPTPLLSSPFHSPSLDLRYQHFPHNGHISASSKPSSFFLLTSDLHRHFNATSLSPPFAETESLGACIIHSRTSAAPAWYVISELLGSSTVTSRERSLNVKYTEYYVLTVSRLCVDCGRCAGVTYYTVVAVHSFIFSQSETQTSCISLLIRRRTRTDTG